MTVATMMMRLMYIQAVWIFGMMGPANIAHRPCTTTIPANTPYMVPRPADHSPSRAIEIQDRSMRERVSTHVSLVLTKRMRCKHTVDRTHAADKTQRVAVSNQKTQRALILFSSKVMCPPVKPSRGRHSRCHISLNQLLSMQYMPNEVLTNAKPTQRMSILAVNHP